MARAESNLLYLTLKRSLGPITFEKYKNMELKVLMKEVWDTATMVSFWFSFASSTLFFDRLLLFFILFC